MWNPESDAEDAFRKKVILTSAAIVALGIVGSILYYKYHGKPTASQPTTLEPAAEPKSVMPQAATEPAVRNPIPAGQSADMKPLPTLNESDADTRAALVGLFGAKSVEQFLVPENIVRRIVATLDNLPRKRVAVELRPVKPTSGATAVNVQGDVTTLSTENYARYTPFVKVVEGTDAKGLAAVYFRLYPLFQQAYEDLGYPGQYFNDRLIEVIDEMLRAPEIQGPIELTQPKVFYEYADAKLESRSPGQKLLIRMGPANEAIVKAKLRELRAAVSSRGDEAVTH